MTAQTDTPTQPEASKKKLYVKTYGCQMNVYDSERMTETLTDQGYEAVDTPDAADLVLLNTCHIREKAAEKVYSDLGRLRKLERQRGKPMQVGVAGCVAQAEGEEIVRRMPQVDLVVGPQAYHRLPQMLSALEAGEGAQVITDFPANDKFADLPATRKSSGPTAFLSVQEGCDKFCAFCVVPYTRGGEYSRPAADLLTEAKRLVETGAREITLLGQNVNAYHGKGPDGDWSLARLVREMAKIDDLARIRYTTSHPNDMSDDLIAAHGEIDRLMPFLHLPVQAGSDKILKAMNRKHDADSYRRLIERIRAARPDIAMSGDFIVGFPGETDEDFEETLRLINDIQYAQAFSFKYSPRPGTPAASTEQLPEDLKSERLLRVQEALAKSEASFQQTCVGKTMPVLLDRPGKFEGQMMGRSPYLQNVHLMVDASRRGEIVPVTITEAHRSSLGGTLAS
jgi:tRNA-2-methylthio-N6-dimethylallyladenosine synthase